MRGTAAAFILALFCSGLAAACGGDQPASTPSQIQAFNDSAPTRCTPPPEAVSVARFWNEVALQTIRIEFPEPTIHARNLYHLSAAMWDAWAYFEPSGVGLFTQNPDRESLDAVDESVRRAAQLDAIMHAAAGVLVNRYNANLGASFEIDQSLLDSCATHRGDELPSGSGAAIGAQIADVILGATLNDGSKPPDEPYPTLNPPLSPADGLADVVDVNRWQPLVLEGAVSRNGAPEPPGPQTFLSPHWGSVTGFAITDGWATYDPGPPPYFGESPESRADFVAGVMVTLRAGAALEPELETIELSPAVNGNRPLGSYDGSGYPQNPVTGLAYAPNVADLADYGRVIAEFWADGPRSETPPGHWNVLANVVSDAMADDARRIGGEGPVVDRLEWDVKLYLGLNGALHDAAIAGWGSKAQYDFVRPITAIRYLGSFGQSSDSSFVAFNELGLPLESGVVEVITAQSSAPGERHAHLSDHVGRIAVRSWLGTASSTGSAIGGVGWVLSNEWLPYQLPTFVTPAFPAYVSGHSAFSRAAAELLTGFTGSAYFPDGLGAHVVEPGGLRHEAGPTATVTLQWATYFDAADEAGLSRLYGGIHVPADDLAGRAMGASVGAKAWERASAIFAVS